MRVVIAEDLALLRDGLTRLLEAFDFEVVEAVDNGPALLPALIKHRPDVAVVDVRLPPTFTDEGLQAAIAARTEVPGHADPGALPARRAAVRARAADRPQRRRRLSAEGPDLQRRPVRRRGTPGGRRRHRDGPRGGLPAPGPPRAAGHPHRPRARGARRHGRGPVERGHRRPSSSSPRRRSANTSTTSSPSSTWPRPTTTTAASWPSWPTSTPEPRLRSAIPSAASPPGPARRKPSRTGPARR